ncbi:MAG: DUF6273 domain-containing protein [Erysipelotrichaceae bacterium]|nr:DUF6273 domain-containing protein [Erysipelotrichaceae bacterium]
MKKLFITLLTVLIVTVTGATKIFAQEQDMITKDFLKNELKMSDNDIISEGLGFVYEIGDEITLIVNNPNKLLVERDSGSFYIPQGDIEFFFEVADKGRDGTNYLTLISKNVFLNKLTSMDTNSNKNTYTSQSYNNVWASHFLNTTVYNLFDQSIKNRIAQTAKDYNVLLNDSVFVDVTANGGVYNTESSDFYLFIPSAKELGFAATYSNGLKTLGTTYKLYEEDSKPFNLNGCPYLLRDSYYSNNNVYFLSTAESMLNSTLSTDKDKAGLIFGMNVTWDEGLIDDVDVADSVKDDQTIAVKTFVSSTYAVDLPEQITLSDGRTTFTYTVSGDLCEENVVHVIMPQTSYLKYDGSISKSSVNIGILNPKNSYNYLECADEGTSTEVTIRYSIPSAGNWSGEIPVTIALS